MKGHRPNSNALAIPTPDKEPAARRSSGLAHLMSALHQNAAAVVNSKTQLNGPDQVRFKSIAVVEGISGKTAHLIYFPWAFSHFQKSFELELKELSFQTSERFSLCTEVFSFSLC